MHIAIFSPSLRGGGAERFAVRLANGLVADGYTVDMVLAKAEGNYFDVLSPEIKVIDLNASRVAVSLSGLVNYLRRYRPQFLVSTMDHANLLATLARYLSRVPVPVIATVHNDLTQIWQQGTFKDRLIIRLLRFFYPRTQRIVAVSTGVAEGLIKMTGISPDQVDVVYNPVVTPEIFEKAAEIPDHPWLIDSQKQVILAVGRLSEQKDYPTLIHAFARVCQQHDVYLIVLGEGEERQKIENLIVDLQLEAQVSMPGFVPNPFAYMAQADLFVLSSRHEGLPTVLIEAMACGSPVVSTDCPSGPAEILDNGRYGQLVPVADAEKLADAVVSTLKNPPARNMLIERAKLYSVSNSVGAYKELFTILEAKGKK